MPTKDLVVFRGTLNGRNFEGRGIIEGYYHLDLKTSTQRMRELLQLPPDAKLVIKSISVEPQHPELTQAQAEKLLDSAR